MNAEKKKNDITCLVYIGIPIIMVLTYKVVEFFKAPNAIKQIVEFLKMMGICLGVVLLLFVCLVVYMYIVATVQEKRLNTILRFGRDYPVRCYVINMKECERYDSIPIDLPEEPGQGTKAPIYINVTVTGHGVCITGHSKSNEGEMSISDDEIPLVWFNRDWSNPVIIPTCYITLGYISGNQPEITMLFGKFIQKSALKTVERLNQPLKLRMVALNENGDVDTIATNELYEIVYEHKQPIESDEDDSWLYRSRPILW